MAENIGYSSKFIRAPEGLLFNGKTDNEGKLKLLFHPKELRLGSDYEIGLDSFSIDTTDMWNIYENQYAIIFRNSVNIETRKFLPGCKIATVLELLDAMNKLDMGFIMNFSHIHAHSIDLKQGKLSLPMSLARSLSIVDPDFTVSNLVSRLNPTCTFNKEKIIVNSEEKKYITIRATATINFNFPVRYHKNIWNTVSEHSFQSLYFYSDIVTTEIISGVRVRFLGVFPFNELALINNYRSIEPIWRRVDKDIIAECYVEIADSRGRLFKNVVMSVHCKIRRRNLK